MLRMQSSMIRAIMFTAMPERRVRLFNSVVCEPQGIYFGGDLCIQQFQNYHKELMPASNRLFALDTVATQHV